MYIYDFHSLFQPYFIYVVSTVKLEMRIIPLRGGKFCFYLNTKSVYVSNENNHNLYIPHASTNSPEIILIIQTGKTNLRDDSIFKNRPPPPWEGNRFTVE